MWKTGNKIFFFIDVCCKNIIWKNYISRRNMFGLIVWKNQWMDKSRNIWEMKQKVGNHLKRMGWSVE